MFVVLFDIDGTLVLTGGAGQAAFAGTFLEDFDVPYFPDDVMFAGRSDRAIAEDIMSHHDLDLTRRRQGTCCPESSNYWET